MEVKFNTVFTHSIIKELNYNLVNPEAFMREEIEPENVSQIIKGEFSLHKDLNKCFIELVTDVKTTVNDENCRSLELSVQFFFDIQGDDEFTKFATEENHDKIFNLIRLKAEDTLVPFCRHQLREIIRQITSIDYLQPLYTETIAIDFSNN